MFIIVLFPVAGHIMEAASKHQIHLFLSARSFLFSINHINLRMSRVFARNLSISKDWNTRDIVSIQRAFSRIYLSFFYFLLFFFYYYYYFIYLAKHIGAVGGGEGNKQINVETNIVQKRKTISWHERD